MIPGFPDPPEQPDTEDLGPPIPARRAGVAQPYSPAAKERPCAGAARSGRFGLPVCRAGLADGDRAG